MRVSTITVIDGRKSRKIDLHRDYLASKDLCSAVGNDSGLKLYDPGFRNTAECKTSISSVDPNQGILRYRGYNAVELSDRYEYLEVVYLLLWGNLPNRTQSSGWQNEVMKHAHLSRSLRARLGKCRLGNCPTAGLISAVASFSESRSETPSAVVDRRHSEICHLLGKLPEIAMAVCNPQSSFSTRNRTASYVSRILRLARKLPQQLSRMDAVGALNKTLILLADHEQSCSTTVMRAVGSTGARPNLCVAAAACAASGFHHGGASEAVHSMLLNICSPKRVVDFVQRVKANRTPLFGFGHSVYRCCDPRSKAIRTLAEQLAFKEEDLELLEVARQLESSVASDEFFISRGLFPTVELYLCILFQVLGFSPEVMPVIFAIARTSGWLAHWNEMMQNQEQPMVRPRQVYTGFRNRALPPESRNVRRLEAYRA